MKKVISFMLAIAICASLVLPCMPMSAFAAALDNFDEGDDYKGLRLSVIGDSITTYYGVSNSKTYNPLYLSTSEATFGTYYGNTSHGDYSEMSHVKRADTWWQQTVDTLDMELLVNNAWSGSFVLSDSGQSNTTEYGVAAYKARCVNLHNGSKKPDIIGVYLGTNDIAYYSELNVGTKADVDTASERNALYTSVNNYKTPSSSVQAYYIMLSRMVATYPDAEIYCMLPTICLNAMSSGRKNALNNFNAGVTYLVDYFAGQGKKVYLVDLNNDSGLVDQATVRSHYYCNNVHPSPEGMDMITTCLISEIMEHSQKGKGTSTLHDITYNLTETFVTTGLPRYAVEGKPFKIDLRPYENYMDVELEVTMTDASTGKKVDIPGYGVSGHSVYIPNVTGPVTINAKAEKKNAYYWQSNDEALISVAGNGFNYNGALLMSGTYSGSNGTGVFTDTQHELEETVLLQYDKPWELEFKGGGGTFAGGIMLMSKTTEGSTSGNYFIHISQANVLFGYRDSVGYNNSGISWETIAEKLGSTAGADIRMETHVFRFVNVPNGTNNKIYLYVDGVQIGSMDAVKLIGASATHASASSVNISGKDFEFNYIGAGSFPLRNCSMSYMKVWENGEKNASSDTSFRKYRWELSGSKNDFVSLDDDGEFTENALNILGGSVSGGEFSGASFEMDKEVVLLHNNPWTIQWESEGDWVDNSNGAMLLSTSLYYKAIEAAYLYRRHASEFISIGVWRNNVHNNYGIRLADYGIDGTARHTYTLANEISGDYNMVYLYVDGEKVGPLDTLFLAGDTVGTKSEWLNGQDFVFSYIGNTEFPLGNCSVDYLEINTGCEHQYDAVVTAPTCTQNGYTTHTCSGCGDSYTDSIVAANGHKWNDATCTTARICSVCGESDGETLGHSYNHVITAPTCTVNGYTTHTCTVCGDVYTDSIVAAAGHKWNEADCTTGKTCSVCGETEGTALGHNWSEGVCDRCDAVCEHNYVDRICTICGMNDPVKDYYLFGYINGEDYACEGNYANLGEYKFVDGSLVVTFEQDSYVGVKTHDNNSWYMTDGWQGMEVTSATLYSTSVLTNADKLYVPGGVEVTFTLVVNENNTLTLSYVAEQKPAVIPTIELKYPTLSFEDEIVLNVFFQTTDLESVAAEDMGLITFSGDVADGNINNADAVIPGTTWNAGTGLYCARTEGVAAKNLGDTIYFRVYAKLADGSYVYSNMASYSPKKYAYTVLNGNYGDDMKALVAAMLNYGAAAQVYFGHNIDALVNADMTDAHKALVKAYSSDMIAPVVKADSAKAANFVNNGGFSRRYPSISFESAFCINYFFAPAYAVDGDIVLYYWSAADYNSADVLTAENATGTVVATSGAEYEAAVKGIAAKDLDGTVYVAAVYESNGTTYCSGVLAYSIGAYCLDRITNGSATMQTFASATAVYGYYAKAYFFK